MHTYQQNGNTVFTNIPEDTRFAVDDEIGGTHSRKLTADGCFQRHTLPRSQQYMRPSEDRIRNFEYRNQAEREEYRLQNMVALLLSMGHRPSLNQDKTLEEFVSRMKAEGVEL